MDQNLVDAIKNITGSLLVITPITIALTEVVKRAAALSARWLPLASVVLGVGVALAWVDLSLTGGLVGVLAGLSASGLYDFGVKTVAGK